MKKFDKLTVRSTKHRLCIWQGLFHYMEFSVYILYSKVKDRYYIGHTEDLDKRIAQHNMRNNLGTNDWIVVYAECFITRSEAMVRELEIKSKKRRSYIEQLIATRK